MDGREVFVVGRTEGEFVVLNFKKTDQDRTNSTTNVRTDYVHLFGNGYKIETGYMGTLRSIADNYRSQSISNLGERGVADSLNNHFL